MVPASRAIGYRPGWGPAPALTSARRRRPAAGSTPPRPWCSPVGCWPGARRWRRDLTGKAERWLLGGEGHSQPVGTPSQSLLGGFPGGAWTKCLMPTLSGQTWSAQAWVQTAWLSELPRLGPAPHLQSASLISHVLGVRLSSQLPASARGQGGRREGKEAGAPEGVYVRAPARGIAAHGGPGSGPWGLGGSGKTGHRRLHQLLQATVTPLTPAPAPRRAMGLVTIANTG